MNTKKIAKLGVSISASVVVLIFILDYFRFFSCHDVSWKKTSVCLDGLGDLAEPVLFFLIVSIPIFTLFFFTRKEVFATWKKFAIWYIGLSAILLIAGAIDGGGGGLGISGSIDIEIISMGLASLFLIISVFIISIKSWRLRKQNKNT